MKYIHCQFVCLFLRYTLHMSKRVKLFVWGIDTIACLTGYPRDMCVAAATHGPQACTLSLLWSFTGASRWWSLKVYRPYKWIIMSSHVNSSTQNFIKMPKLILMYIIPHVRVHNCNCALLTRTSAQWPVQLISITTLPIVVSQQQIWPLNRTQELT